MPADPIFLTPFRALPAPRTWSMVVTIFGDLAQDPDARISGPVLSALTAPMQISPEALRVALHRLRKDGWILSERSGRIAAHGLTREGHAQSRAASPLIYAPMRDMPGDWHVVLLPDTEPGPRNALLAKGYRPVLSRLLLGAGRAAAGPEHAVLAPQTTPDWLFEHLDTDAEQKEASQLLVALIALEGALRRTGPLRAMETAIIRALIVHYWRRIALKYGHLPATLTGPDWPTHQCRDLVASLLHDLPAPALRDLAED